MQTARNVPTHPKMTFKMKSGFRFFEPPSKPTPIVPPTWHCVVETGMPMNEAMTTIVDADSSMQKPLEGDNFVIL